MVYALGVAGFHLEDRVKKGFILCRTTRKPASVLAALRQCLDAPSVSAAG